MTKKDNRKPGKKPVQKHSPAKVPKAPKGPQMPKEWLYLAEDEITPAQIYGLSQRRRAGRQNTGKKRR